MLLDCSKAFDRVNYTKLSSLLIDKGLCPITLRVLIHLYTKQHVRVKWCQSFSESINVSNGVKQGGILSPILFIVYMDILMLKLKQSKLGCHMGNRFCGALAYTDDVSLLCPSMSSLRMMLSIIDEFGKEYDVSFNSEKYQLIVYSDRSVEGIHHNGMFVKSQRSANHLGNIIGPRVSDKSITYVSDKFSIACNTLLNTFSHLSYDVKYKLFKSYCTPLYGCIHWDLSSIHVQTFYKQWRKGIRRVFDVSPRTHCYLLPLLCSDIPIETQLCKRILNFYCKIHESSNNIA